MALLSKLTLLAGAALAKDHFIVESPMQDEHPLVQASGQICELCFFNDAVDYNKDSNNKFCLTMSGSQRLGFEWTQQSQAYSKANNEGYVELYLNFYSKQSLAMNPVFQLDRAISNSMNFELEEFSAKFTTAFKYNIWMNMLCFDISTSVDEYKFLVDMSVRVIECYKVMVDSFFDFGQWSSSDNYSSEKPYSPFAKLLDKCTLSSTQTVTVKDYQPLLGDTTRTQYWVGSGSYDDACYPGNILMWLIDYDHNKAVYGAPGPQVQSEEDEFWKNTVLLEYIKPMYVSAVTEGINTI
jgi:hypothetical protein